MPTDIEAFSCWDFEVLAADFVYRAEDMRDVFNSCLVDARCRSRPAWDIQIRRIAKLYDTLEEACAAGRDVTLDGHDIWDLMSGMMFDRRFVSAGCPECSREFGPEACRVLEWSYGSGLCGEAGRRVVCPAGHTLYALAEYEA
jgi:hypothetical protein